jgi:hypothetical protein
MIDMLDNKEQNIVQIFVRPPMTQIYGNSESHSEDRVLFSFVCVGGRGEGGLFLFIGNNG